MKLGDNSLAHECGGGSPTGSLSLDLALGIGGLPKGRIIEIHAPESSGKTTVALACGRGTEVEAVSPDLLMREHAL